MHAPGMYPRDADTWTRTGAVWSEDCHPPPHHTSMVWACIRMSSVRALEPWDHPGTVVRVLPRRARR
eukprot:7134506-Prymnesium_polylepis.1